MFLLLEIYVHNGPPEFVKFSTLDRSICIYSMVSARSDLNPTILLDSAKKVQIRPDPDPQL